MQFQKNVDSVVATGTGSAQTNISSAGIVSVKWTEATHEIYKAYFSLCLTFSLFDSFDLALFFVDIYNFNNIF